MIQYILPSQFKVFFQQHNQHSNIFNLFYSSSLYIFCNSFLSKNIKKVNYIAFFIIFFAISSYIFAYSPSGSK